MANSYERQAEIRYEGHKDVLFRKWRSSVIVADLQLFQDKNNMLRYMLSQDLGFAALTCGPPNNKLGMFELYVRGRDITVKNTIKPDLTYTQYVLSSDARSGDTRVFTDMDTLVDYCKQQAMELSNDKADYETLRELDALRATEICDRDICEDMGSLQLKDNRRVRLGARRTSMPPFVDRTTKPRLPVDDVTAAGPSDCRNVTVNGKRMTGASCEAPRAAYRESNAERSPPRHSSAVESGYYLTHAASGTGKKVEFDGDYGWLANFQ